jgi:hypothetical protein
MKQMTAEKSPQESEVSWARQNLLLLSLSLAAFLVHIIVSATTAYGIFRDELYYIACSSHLDWGFVDQPPLSLLLLRLNRALFGESLPALRLMPGLAHAAIVLLSGLLAKELGGKRFAQSLAALCSLFAPAYLGIFDFYSMNSFDILFWALVFLAVVRLLKTGNRSLWLLIGLLAGLGLQNKLSVLFLLFGLGIGLLATRHRRWLLTKWPWLALLVACLIAMPYLVWQVIHDWPTLEFMRNATLYKNVPVTFTEYLTEQFLIMGPPTALVWVPGFLFLFFSEKASPYRIFAWMYLAIFAVFIAQNGKPYYQSPAYTILFAAGAAAWEGFLARRRFSWPKPVLVSLVVAGGIIVAPMAIPVLPVESYIAYRNALGIPAQTEEQSAVGALDQHYADMFGWRELAETVAQVYRDLTPEEQQRCAIYTQNYGQAGAIDFFGREWGLPRALSGHNSYWFWGPGEETTGEIVIIVGEELEDHAPQFESCEQAALHTHRYARPFETNLRIFVCRNLKVPLSEVWQETRNFI